MYRRTFLIVLIAVLMAGCSMQKLTTRTVGKISWKGAAVLDAERDVELARDNTIPLIMSLEVFAAGDPDDRRYLALLAKSYSQYAFAFYDEDLLRYRGRDDAKYRVSLRRADLFYERGKDYGVRALSTKGATAGALNGALPELEKALGNWGKKDVPVLFWSAFAWGNWLNLHKDNPTAIVDTPRVQAIVERVVELDPTYAYGSAQSFLGAIHASRPKMLGGNPAKAKEYFEKAIEIAPNYLMNKVMMAQYAAVQTQDRALFNRLLQDVLSADVSALPEQRLANEVAKKRAVLLLARVEELF